MPAGRVSKRADVAFRTLVREFPRLDAVQRSFPHHYLLYVRAGAIRLEADGRTWVLPPQRAAWIDAGTPVAVSSTRPFTTASVMFDTRTFPATTRGCRVFAMSPLARELVAHVTSAPDASDRSTALAGRLLAELAHALAATPDDFWLPRARSPALQRAIDALLAEPSTAPPVSSAAASAAMSERTFSRRLAQECAMSWRELVHRARMMRATELLASPRPKLAAVAQAVGFSAQPAFVAAFRKFAGETPSSFRRRHTARADWPIRASERRNGGRATGDR